MRVLVQGMNFAPESIGVGKYTTQLVRYLADRGTAVEVVTALPHYPSWRATGPRRWTVSTSPDNGVRVTRCPLLARPGGRLWRLLAPLSFALAAAPILVWRSLVLRPNVILCVEPTLFAAPAAMLAGWLVGAKVVLHVQDLEIDAAFATGHLEGRALQRFATAAERFLLRRMDAVVTISDAMAARLRDRGVAASRLTVLRNWIAQAGRLDGCSLPVPTGRRIVLYAGNLGYKQGVAVLIEAARRLRCRSDICLVVVGDGPMAPTLKAAAASLPNMTVLDVVSPEHLHGLLAAADCHVLPQDRAAGDLVFPSKIGPILASGRPCVITSDPWRELARWVGGAATVVPPGDGRTLAEALVVEIGRAAAHNGMAARALAACLDASDILARFEQVLRQAAAQPAGDPTWSLPEPVYASAG